jgi:hypothetical protein
MICAMTVCSGKRRQPGTGCVHDEVLCASKKEFRLLLIIARHQRPRLPSNIKGSLITCEVIPNQENVKELSVPCMFRESDGCSIITWFGTILIASEQGDD